MKYLELLPTRPVEYTKVFETPDNVHPGPEMLAMLAPIR